MTCESEGVSVTKLKWKRQTAEGDVSVKDNMVTVDKGRSNNRIRVTLTIGNVQPKDGGVYKCVLMVFNKTDYKQTTILVKGILNRPHTSVFLQESCVHHYHYHILSSSLSLSLSLSLLLGKYATQINVSSIVRDPRRYFSSYEV